MKEKLNPEKNPKELLTEIKDTVQDCHINFLVGAGLSAPYLSLLGQIESLLTELSEKKETGEVEKEQETLIRVSLYKKFFEDLIVKNLDILSWTEKSNSESSNNNNLEKTLNNYKKFFKTINTILLNRRSAILSKQVNIFTTNFDIFIEKALEMTHIEYNDGFSGRFKPIFSLSNFKKSFFKRSLHYDNIYELPVFNLMKIHGSLTWLKSSENEDIYFHKDLKLIKNLKKIEIPKEELLDIPTNKEGEEVDTGLSNNTIKDLIEKSKNKQLSPSSKNFIDEFIYEYEKLAIINPTKEKFKETVLNNNHYDLLRVYSTELEKENTVLFVMGFSFSDEHIREITVRALNSNPTLKVYIFAHTENDKLDIEKRIKNKVNNENIQIISAKDLSLNNSQSDSRDTALDISTINKNIFKKLLRKINK